MFNVSILIATFAALIKMAQAMFFTSGGDMRQVIVWLVIIAILMVMYAIGWRAVKRYLFGKKTKWLSFTAISILFFYLGMYTPGEDGQQLMFWSIIIGPMALILFMASFRKK